SAREQKEDAERRARERAEDYERTLKEIEYRHQLALELEDYRRQYSEEEGVTSRQLANYNQLIQSFLNPENRTTGGDPQKALEWMARMEQADPNAYINLVGKQLRDQLMLDLQTAIMTPP